MCSLRGAVRGAPVVVRNGKVIVNHHLREGSGASSDPYRSVWRVWRFDTRQCENFLCFCCHQTAVTLRFKVGLLHRRHLAVTATTLTHCLRGRKLHGEDTCTFTPESITPRSFNCLTEQRSSSQKSTTALHNSRAPLRSLVSRLPKSYQVQRPWSAWCCHGACLTLKLGSASRLVCCCRSPLAIA